MVSVRSSLGEVIEEGYKNNDNITYQINYHSDPYLFDKIKVKTFENPINMDIFIVFNDNKDLLKEDERKSFKETVNVNDEYFFIFDFLKRYTNLSKQKISTILSDEMFVEGGTSKHTCTLVLPVRFIDIE